MDLHYDYEVTFDDEYNENEYINDTTNYPVVDDNLRKNQVIEKTDMMAYVLKFVPGIHKIISFVDNENKRVRVVVNNTNWVPSSPREPPVASENLGSTEKIQKKYLKINETVLALFDKDAYDIYVNNQGSFLSDI